MRRGLPGALDRRASPRPSQRWDAQTVKRGGDEVVLYLFLGTRDQYQAFKDLKDEHGDPIPGMRSPTG